MKKNRCKIVLINLLFLFSCQKSFLSERPDKALLIPTKLEDFEALLDNSNFVMNVSPYLNTISSDEIIVSEAGLLTFPNIQLNAYFWEEDIFGADGTHDWSSSYQQIFYANVVLEGLDEILITEKNSIKINQIKGAALFFRALAYYNLTQLFAVPYENEKAFESFGIPLKLSADVNERPKRGTLQGTYNQILEDLIQARDLLPVKVPVKTKPSKTAALGLLARVYLNMSDFENAIKYATQCLSLQNELIDYNSLELSSEWPMPLAIPNEGNVENVEVIFYTFPLVSTQLIASETRINPDIINLYESNDLRKSLFLNSNNNFKGSYTGNIIPFTGIAVDEIFLIRAEANVRLNRIQAGNEDLNILLMKRYKNGTYKPSNINDREKLLKLILKERVKELLYRGLRWSDLKRLNLEPEFETVIFRVRDELEVLLRPNSNRYVFPIPLREIGENSLSQNPR